MKKFAILATTAVALTACAQTAPEQKPIGMANPASVFCEQQGGKSVIRKNKDGSEYGACVFPNGKEVEEWEYFRANAPK